MLLLATHAGGRAVGNEFYVLTWLDYGNELLSQALV